MNRNKTAQLLNEWKSFLREGKEPTFSKDDVGIKVKISPCCDSCKEYFTDKNLDSYKNKTGTLTGHDVPNREIPGRGEENFIVVSVDDKEKQFPQCCVKRESGAK